MNEGVIMKLRTFSSGVLIFILVLSFMLGRYVFGMVMLGCAMIGYRELFHIKYQNRSQNISVMSCVGYICLIMMCLNDVFFEMDYSFILLLSILLFTIPVVFYNDSNVYNINDAFFLLGSLLFLGFSFHNIIYMGSVDIYKCIFIFLISFSTDTYAYVAGKLIGRHKLTDISPKKTIEGSVVGTIMGCLIGSVYYHLVIGGLSLPAIIIFCFILTILSEVGDLVFSSIKRYFNQKDYSNFIPGHGGILDRFDSVIFVSLVFSLLIKII